MEKKMEFEMERRLACFVVCPSAALRAVELLFVNVHTAGVSFEEEGENVLCS